MVHLTIDRLRITVYLNYQHSIPGTYYMLPLNLAQPKLCVENSCVRSVYALLWDVQWPKPWTLITPSVSIKRQQQFWLLLRRRISWRSISTVWLKTREKHGPMCLHLVIINRHGYGADCRNIFTKGTQLCTSNQRLRRGVHQWNKTGKYFCDLYA